MPYVTGNVDLDVDRIEMQDDGNNNSNENRQSTQNQPSNPLYAIMVQDKVTEEQILNAVVTRLWNANRKELERNCLLKDVSMFRECMKSISKEIDLRMLFGGMSLYSNARKLIANATDGLYDMPGMPTTFLSGSKVIDAINLQCAHLIILLHEYKRIDSSYLLFSASSSYAGSRSDPEGSNLQWSEPGYPRLPSV